MNLFRPFYNLDETDVKKLRLAERNIFKNSFKLIAGTIKANSPTRTEKMTEQIKLNDKNNAKIDGTNRIYKNSIKKFQLQKTQFSENAILTEPTPGKKERGAFTPLLETQCHVAWTLFRGQQRSIHAGFKNREP